MKLSKKQLKSIIKECLVEILSEGLGPSTLVESNVMRSYDQLPVRNKIDQNNRHVTIDKNRNNADINPTLENAINESAGSDPIMREILKDTAKTTLPAYLKGDSHTNPPVTDVDISENFESDRWAALAFNN